MKHKFNLILRTFGRESYSNNFIRCLYNRVRCILTHNFLELSKSCVLKVYCILRSSVNCSRIRPQINKIFRIQIFLWDTIMHLISFKDNDINYFLNVPFFFFILSQIIFLIYNSNLKQVSSFRLRVSRCYATKIILVPTP